MGKQQNAFFFILFIDTDTCTIVFFLFLFTVQSLYNMPYYNTDLDLTRSCIDAKN